MGSVTLAITTFCVVVIATIVAMFYFTWWKALLVGNAVLGYSLLELAWRLIPRYLTPNEDRDSRFPAFRRLDCANWQKWMFIPGAVTLFPIRMVVSLGTLVVLVGWLRISMMGHKWGTEPLSGWRLKANYYGYMVSTWLIVSSSFMTMKLHHVDFDYSEHLGKDYLKTQVLPKKVSTIVSNHMAWLDSLILIHTLYPGFAAKIETKKVPILRDLINNLQSIYISRSGS
jgi:hypothetical protein